MPELTAKVLPIINQSRLSNLPLDEHLTMPNHDGFSLHNLPATISHLLGAPEFSGPALHPLILDKLNGPYRKVILVLVDALGYDLFEQVVKEDPNLVWARYFDQSVFSPLTSICPSTTASALTSLWTGVGAAAHGIVGYEMWSKTYGTVINNILHTPSNAKNDVGGLYRFGFEPKEFMNKPLLGEHLVANGVKPTSFMHASIARSGLSVIQMRGVSIQTYVDEADLSVSLARYLNRQPGEREYIYVYYSDIDSLIHRYDAVDSRVKLQFSAFSDLFDRGFIQRVNREVAEETLLILTADHGSIGTPPDNQYDLKYHPRLTSCLVMQPTCEGRLPVLTIKPGRVDEVYDYFEKAWPGDFTLVDSKQALESGLFGTGPFVDEIEDRLGDLVVIPRGSAYLWWADKHNVMAGRHGGLSAGEMIIPLFAFPLKNLF